MTKKSTDEHSRSSIEIREFLVEALKLDLVGPGPGHRLAEERLPIRERPSNWYLTGFLIPTNSKLEHRADPDEDDDVGEIPEAAGLAEESAEERKAAKKGYFPSSMGLSFLVSSTATTVSVGVRWGDYTPGEFEKDGKAIPIWQRKPRAAFLDVPLDGKESDPRTYTVPDSGGLVLQVVERQVKAGRLEAHFSQGVRSVSVFLVNHRPPDEERPNRAFVFQPELEVTGAEPFVPRPDLRGMQAEEWDERVADLHFADLPEYATGHGVSADWDLLDGACRVLRTSWIPSAGVEKTTTEQIDGVELSMVALGKLADGKAALAALRPLVERYRAWIIAQGADLDKLSESRRETARELLRHAELAADRIEKGIAVLGRDADALDAFRMANRAVARALAKRLKTTQLAWRAFQLAFILLNLPGLADPADANRNTVDLLFFPTGGGKTEAYLGLAAFAMVLRRLRHPQDNGLGGAGVSVIMRYTLRLLTLDQLGRAAGLVCALELERGEHAERYGSWPFEIGLWVGKAATPNKMGRRGEDQPDTARKKVSQFKLDPRHKPSPIPLESCPWCGARFTEKSFSLRPDDHNPTELRIVCANFECDFTRDRPLPIVAVDEPLYRRLPAFLIATVDKFASLPWVGESGVLLGGAERADDAGFYGPATPGVGHRLSGALPPPDLIIQDELHLISGPLGTMAGLYETAIEALCVRMVDGRAIHPKIVASTATVRRAEDQVQALFARPLTHIFPPPGQDRRDSFFARTRLATEVPTRLYLGVAAQGRNPKEVMRRVWLTLMSAAQKAYRDNGGHKNEQNPADPYMTTLGYFNSLRELGGARRIIEEQIQNTIKEYGRRLRIGDEQGFFQSRKTFNEVVELTSRVSTDKIAEARHRMERGFHEEQRVDCAIATNMISVGLDIPRLGLMVVFGQPKTHSEYIQATSRIGRDDARPGLVVTLLNVHKPRDRSHYERFRHYHETFYRAVEVSSVTPFSARALDRGLAGVLVALARHIESEMTPYAGVACLQKQRAVLEPRLQEIFQQRVRQQPMADEEERQECLQSVQGRVADLLDSWLKVVGYYQRDGVGVQYQRYEKKPLKPLLREMLEQIDESVHHRKFRANRSLRDVEPEVNLFLRDAKDDSLGEEA
jgi:hypothetical protein